MLARQCLSLLHAVSLRRRMAAAQFVLRHSTTKHVVRSDPDCAFAQSRPCAPGHVALVQIPLLWVLDTVCCRPETLYVVSFCCSCQTSRLYSSSARLQISWQGMDFDTPDEGVQGSQGRQGIRVEAAVLKAESDHIRPPTLFSYPRRDAN